MSKEQKLSVVLSRPKVSGNVGSIARVMKNFDINELLLIDPRCKTSTLQAKRHAKHAQDVLQNAKTVDWKYLKRFDIIAATTGKDHSDYNIPRIPLTPKQAAEKICKVKGRIAILFGPEDDGLRNEDIKNADFCITIPASKSYQTLNLSQSAAIILYELHQAKNKKSTLIKPLSGREKELLLKKTKKLLKDMDFKTSDRRSTQELLWKRLIGKGFLSKREGFALFGFFEKIQPKCQKKR